MLSAKRIREAFPTKEQAEIRTAQMPRSACATLAACPQGSLNGRTMLRAT